jgi:hypothetical protein
VEGKGVSVHQPHDLEEHVIREVVSAGKAAHRGEDGTFKGIRECAVPSGCPWEQRRECEDLHGVLRLRFPQVLIITSGIVIITSGILIITSGIDIITSGFDVVITVVEMLGDGL